MGCSNRSFTCAPYLLDSAPSVGDQIAWGESNAVVFANSVLGARTQKCLLPPPCLPCLLAHPMSTSGLFFGNSHLWEDQVLPYSCAWVLFLIRTVVSLESVVCLGRVAFIRYTRYADYLDICAAITGRVPLAGPHLDSKRIAKVIIDAGPLAAELDSELGDAFFPSLGYLCGLKSEASVPVIVPTTAHVVFFRTRNRRLDCKLPRLSFTSFTGE